MNPYGSALEVLPHVFQLCNLSAPSVVDVGCGDGSWLVAAKELGASRILGMDMHDGLALNAAGRPKLQIMHQDYWQNDLCNPGVPDERFDLAICVEVAEHLPEECAYGLVKYLVTLAPVVLWSAAPPGQGPVGPGPSLHCNERVPAYWAAHFAEFGYRMENAILSLVSNNMAVDPWYRTNVRIVRR